MRQKMMVMLQEGSQGNRTLHFTDTHLAGSNNNLWFPTPMSNEEVITEKTERYLIFTIIEGILTSNNVAHNLVSLNLVRANGKTLDYQIEYNKVMGGMQA